MSFLRNDVRHAFRSLVRSPALAFTAVVTVGLGVGASTTMFSVLRGVLLRPLPYSDPDRIVRLFPALRENPRAPWTGADFVDFTAQASSYDAIAGYQYADYSMTVDGYPRLLRGVSVTSGFFRVFNVQPLLGGTFEPPDDRPQSDRVVVLSHGLWQSRFAAAPEIVGRSIDLGGEGYRVAGVMPARFSFPDGGELWVASRYRAPETPDSAADPAEDRNEKYFNVVARLRAGLQRADAQAEGSLVLGRLAETHPGTNRGQGFNLVSLHELTVSTARPMVLALFGAAGLLLLVACVNVANLLLARAAERSHEIALRTALGAGRHQIVRHVLAESLLVGTVGGGLGIVLSVAATSALRAHVASELPRASEIWVDLSVLTFAVLTSLLASALSSVAPAVWLSRRDPAAGLRESGGRTVVGPARARAALVVVEMAVSLTLLVGLTLLARTLGTLGRVDPGFSSRSAVTAQVWLPGTVPISEDELRVFYGALLERVRTLPGVESAGAVLSLPIDSQVSARTRLRLEGRPVERGAEPVVGLQLASPGYFESIGIPVLRGRDFRATDGPDSPPVTIVSEAFAERYFPDRDPVGQRIATGGPAAQDTAWATVVGVVGSARYGALDSAPRVEVYEPLAQSPMPWISLVLRTDVPAAALAEPLRRAISEVSPTQPVERIISLGEILHESLATRRLHTALLGLIAGLALLLTGAGLYGVVSFSVTTRIREIGIRIAVGASSDDIVRLVVGQGGRLLVIGLTTGAAGGVLLGRLMRGFLYGIPAADPLSFSAAAIILSLAAMAAMLIPTLRALHTDPITSLRAE